MAHSVSWQPGCPLVLGDEQDDNVTVCSNCGQGTWQRQEGARSRVLIILTMPRQHSHSSTQGMSGIKYSHSLNIKDEGTLGVLLAQA